jgi:hypothetical protein
MRLGAVLMLCVIALAGCGRKGVETTATTPRRGPVPASLQAVESAAEDTIDFAVAGQRARAVRTARRLETAADGPVARDLHTAGVPDSEIAGFRRRAAVVARLAPHADLLRVALASNRAFAYVPIFFARYATKVPAAVQGLDHLDYEAKLQAIAHDELSLRGAALQLARAWRGLRGDVLRRPGGARVVARYDEHVARLVKLHGGAARREAQHGLDLVDEVEGVYG